MVRGRGIWAELVSPDQKIRVIIFGSGHHKEVVAAGWSITADSESLVFQLTHKEAISKFVCNPSCSLRFAPY